jgi:enamine deaminase RidA (YjgF/YER057c/UK114 family)
MHTTPTTRQTLHIEGFGHVNPIPAAARKGPLLMSGLINGTDPATGHLADGLDAQCAAMFEQIRRILAAGGGTPDDLVRMTVWLKDRSQREPLNRQWLAMFPDPLRRPARMALHSPDLAGGILVQCEITAYID